MQVIGLIGAKAAGKDTIAEYILSKRNGVMHRFAEILDDILNILHLPITRDNEIKLVNLRDVFGINTLPNALAKKIKDENAGLVIILGIRFQNELDFVKAYPGSKIIFVQADLKTRYERQLQRRQKADDMISFEKFVEVEQARTEVDIEKLGVQADFKVTNNSSPAELYAQIDPILQALV